jgi:REP element-mobilizing transposase RayT
MFSPNPLAYLITFRAYGTWLPGDERGWVQKNDSVYGTPFLPPRAALHRGCAQKLRNPPVLFNERARSIIDWAIRDACEYRKWDLRALNVRSNHTHCVVSAESAPEGVLRILKSRATRILHEHGLFSHEAALWSRHGSTVYLWTEQQVADACSYVME